MSIPEQMQFFIDVITDEDEFYLDIKGFTSDNETYHLTGEADSLNHLYEMLDSISEDVYDSLFDNSEVQSKQCQHTYKYSYNCQEELDALRNDICCYEEEVNHLRELLCELDEDNAKLRNALDVLSEENDSLYEELDNLINLAEQKQEEIAKQEEDEQGEEDDYWKTFFQGTFTDDFLDFLDSLLK